MHFLFLQKVETKMHFILEREAFKDIRESYADMLADSSWDNLFSEGFVEKLRAFILKLHRKRAEYIKQMKKQSIPEAIFSLVDIKIISFFLSISFKCSHFSQLFFTNYVDLKALKVSFGLTLLHSAVVIL